MDCDGSLDPRELPLRGRTRSRRAAPTWCSARARRRARRLAAPRADRQPGARARGAAPRRACALSDLGPMRAAPRGALLELGLRDRRFGWPLEMVLRAADAGWRIGEVAGRPTARARGRSKVTGTRARHRPRGARHGGGAAMSRRHADRDRQGSRCPGRSKTRLCPPCSPEEAAAAGRGGAAPTRSRRRRRPRRRSRRARARRRARRLAAPRASTSSPQRGDGPGRAACGCAFADAGGPAFSSAWTRPQLTAALLDDALGRLRLGARTPCSGRPPTAATGRSASTAARTGVFEGVPMSSAADAARPAAAAARARAATRRAAAAARRGHDRGRARGRRASRRPRGSPPRSRRRPLDRRGLGDAPDQHEPVPEPPAVGGAAAPTACSACRGPTARVAAAPARGEPRRPPQPAAAAAARSGPPGPARRRAPRSARRARPAGRGSTCRRRSWGRPEASGRAPASPGCPPRT